MRLPMTPGSVADFEKIAGFNAQGFGQALQEVEFDTPGSVGFEVGDGRHPHADSLSQSFLGQAAIGA